MHSSGIGKALLAHMDVDRRQRIIKTMTLESYTKFTITDADALNHDLDDIKIAAIALIMKNGIWNAVHRGPRV